MTVGLISDTHGIVRPAALEALRGVDLILHAGDVGHPTVIEQLETIAPVLAVSGNCDSPGLFQHALDLEFDGVKVHVSHGHECGLTTPDCLVETYPAADVIVFGHTHCALVQPVGTTLVINPGAAGPGKTPSLAILTLPAREVSIVRLPTPIVKQGFTSLSMCVLSLLLSPAACRGVS